MRKDDFLRYSADGPTLELRGELVEFMRLKRNGFALCEAGGIERALDPLFLAPVPIPRALRQLVREMLRHKGATSDKEHPLDIGGGRATLATAIAAMRSPAIVRVAVSAPLFGLVDYPKEAALRRLEQYAQGNAAAMLLAEHPGCSIEVSLGLRPHYRRGAYGKDTGKAVLWLHDVGIWPGDGNVYTRGL